MGYVRVYFMFIRIIILLLLPVILCMILTGSSFVDDLLLKVIIRLAFVFFLVVYVSLSFTAWLFFWEYHALRRRMANTPYGREFLMLAYYSFLFVAAWCIAMCIILVTYDILKALYLML